MKERIFLFLVGVRARFSPFDLTIASWQSILIRDCASLNKTAEEIIEFILSDKPKSD